jgi:hypothetical protein
MPLLDTLKDSVTKVFPRKDAESPVDTAPLGYGNSLRPFDDDVRFAILLLLKVC